MPQNAAYGNQIAVTRTRPQGGGRGRSLGCSRRDCADPILKCAGQLSSHSLRHTFATSLDDAGVPLHDIQDAMG